MYIARGIHVHVCTMYNEFAVHVLCNLIED